MVTAIPEVRLNDRMTQLPHGWVKFAPLSFWRAPTAPSTTASRARLAIATVATAAIVVLLVGEQTIDPLLLVCIAFLLSSILPVVIDAVRNPTPELNFDTDEARVSRRVYPMTTITEASFVELPSRGRTDWFLQFGAPPAIRLFVVVASQKRTVIDTTERELVAELLRRSAVAIPPDIPDRYDPAGKFAWMDHPKSLTRDEAIEYVLHTPESGEPARTPPRPKSIWIDDDE